jgi:hypothetical protein
MFQKDRRPKLGVKLARFSRDDDSENGSIFVRQTGGDPIYRSPLLPQETGSGSNNRSTPPSKLGAILAR